MTILAIDQGTSSTKALVVADDGARPRRGRGPGAPPQPATGAVEQDPEELWQSVLDGGHAGARAGRRARSARWVSPTRARRCWRGIARSGRPLSRALIWQDRRAAERVRATCAAAPSGCAPSPGCRSTPTSRRRRCAGCGATSRAAGVVHDHRRVAAPPPRGRLRDRRRHRLADAAARPRRRLLVARGLRGFGLDPTLPRIVDCAEPVGETAAFGRVAAALRAGRRPASGAVRRVLLRRRRGQVHLRHRRFPPRHRRRAAAALDSRPRRLHRLATAGQHAYCLDGQVYTAGAAVDWLRTVGLIGDAARARRGGARRPTPGRRVRPRAGRPRRAVLAPRQRAAPSTRPAASHTRRGASRPRRGRGHRGPGRAAGGARPPATSACR